MKLASSIEHGGTKTFSNIMAQLALFNEGVQDTFLTYGGTHNEAPKRKNVALLTL